MGKKRKPESCQNIAPYDVLLEAVATGNSMLAAQAIANGADLSQLDPHGFAPLQRLVTNENISSSATCQLIELLVDHGADPNAISKDGRSVIFLAAEFQQRKAAVETLLKAGADPSVTNSYGTHITENARAKVVRKLLESATGKRVVQTKTASKNEQQLSSSQWASGRRRISRVFAKLEAKRILCLHQAGASQDEGLDECSEQIQERGGIEGSGIIGCCFYTRQDQLRCKDQGFLRLAFWAAPSGKDKDMLRVGQIIVDGCRESGFDVEWEGTADNRPVIWI